MKKFIVKYKNNNKIFGEFTSKEEASDKVMEYINGHYISPFDFELEEVECNDVNEVITDFESARRALGFNPNSDFTVVKKSHYENTIHLKDVTRLVSEIAPKHLEALIALNKLFTIAEAWNKEDGFVPDPSNVHQKIYLPWFTYSNKDKMFKYSNNICCTSSYDIPTFGHRLCFKTKKRAEQFGRQFAYLYNRVLMS